PDGEVAVEGGVLTRDLFERTMGQLATIYMTSSDGSLRRLGRAMAAEDAVSPRMVLEKLFADPAAWDEGVVRVIPDGLSVDDLLGVRVADGLATLNFSAAFYAGCQRLTAQQERNLVYALVNTLTERGDVTAVRFQFEGETVPVLVHSISLYGPLVRNPGLIQGAAAAQTQSR
ncbi:MAG: GerMN domain-containing protein, partial [Clostridia bacterium]|nr:GerMN domain-containing protein [Clostridia bacterium]